MRRWVMAAVLAGLAHGAQAADLPDLSDLPVLRGAFEDGLSKSTVNWQGAYVGAQAGYSSGNMDFSQATQSLTNYLLQNQALQSTVSPWTLLGKASPTSAGFGGFVGYNAQWDDAVLGIEANYTHLSGLTGASSNTLPPLIITGNAGCWQFAGVTNTFCSEQMSGSATAQFKDTLTLRGRAGWSIDNFMPYMFGGLALGRVDIVRNVTLTQRDVYSDGSTYKSVTPYTETNTNLLAYGYTAGLGLEAMLFGNLFGRAEYEYIKFTSLKNVTNISMNSFRAGLGYKF